MAVLKIEDLLAKKEERGKKEFTPVFVQALGGEILLERVPLTRITNLVNSLDDGLESMVELIYTCVPLFRDKKLRDAYDVERPQDIVCAVLDDNLGAINTITLAILAMYGIELEDPIAAIKNA